jgi:cyclopropane fatty-acyl-phospholipid synthase-like methyltransferase
MQDEPKPVEERHRSTIEDAAGEKSMSELERWEGRFSAPGYVFGTEPNAFLKSQAHRLRRGDKALSVADGEGRNGVWLAEQGLDVLAVDFSPTALEKSRALAKLRGVSLRTERADLAQWSWPTAAFDVIVGIFVQFLGPEQRPKFFAGIQQALKPGGLLLMQGYRPEQRVYKTGGPSNVEQLYTRALLERSFADFASLDIREHDSAISEGTGHVGMSALIDLVGRK